MADQDNSAKHKKVPPRRERPHTKPPPGAPSRSRSQGEPPNPASSVAEPFGIQDAIKLLRKLPQGDMRVLATVVNHTLESLSVDVDGILSDAQAQEVTLENEIKTLETEIENLEAEISRRERSIAALSSNLSETRAVRQHLAAAHDDPAPSAEADQQEPVSEARVGQEELHDEAYEDEDSYQSHHGSYSHEEASLGDSYHESGPSKAVVLDGLFKSGVRNKKPS